MAEPATLPELLAFNAERYGDKPAVVTGSDRLAHRELDRRSAELAARLVAAGVGKSARVGLMMPNGTEWAVTAAAVMRVGGVLVPLSTLLKPPELTAHLTIASVTHLVAVEEFRGRSYLEELDAVAGDISARTASGGRHPALPHLVAVWAASRLPAAPVEPELVHALEQRVGPADDMVVLFTSGSRGVPKGVIHTHGNALRAAAAGLGCRGVTADDRMYIPMPFFWTGGFSSGLISVLVAGATLITEAVPDPDRTLDLLEREKVTLFRGWPDQAARLAAHPRFASARLDSLKPGSLAAVLPPEQRPAPGARANLFGMTETFGPYCGDRLDTDMPTGKHGSCGRPFAGVEVSIVEPETGEACPPGAEGEIRLRGPNLMRGICGRTREEVFDVDGYYHTGDMGSLDADGYLWYHGRRDDMFKVKGATVYPAEVESALRSLPGVEQAFVTDVAGPVGAAEVGAVVVGGVALDELARAARACLSSFKVPTLWYVTDQMDDVPRSGTDKVSKPGLQELLAAKGRPSRGR